MREWTWLIYIAAHNDLQAHGEASYAQIKAVGSSDAVKFTVLYDSAMGAERWDSTAPDKGTRKRLVDFDSGDAGKLVETAKWAFETYPAKRHGLILWSHGTGWMPHELEKVARQARGDDAVKVVETQDRAVVTPAPALFRSTMAHMLRQPTRSERAICFDDGSQHSLDAVELGRVMAQIAAHIKQPVDVLGMDACMMASLEVAQELAGHARMLVASPEPTPATSWPYDVLFSALQSKPDQDAADVARLAVDAFAARYIDDRPPPSGKLGTAWLCALEVANAGALAPSLHALAQALLNGGPAARKALLAAQTACQLKETRENTRKPNKFGYFLWDVGSLAAALAKSSTDDAVRAAATAVQRELAGGGAIAAQWRHPKDAFFEGCAGLTVFLPPEAKDIVKRLTPYYAQTQFARGNAWLKLLEALHAK